MLSKQAVILLTLIHVVLAQDRFLKPYYDDQYPACPAIGRIEVGFVRERRDEKGEEGVFAVNENFQRVSCRKGNGRQGPHVTVYDVSLKKCRGLALNPRYVAFEHTCFFKPCGVGCVCTYRCDLLLRRPNHLQVVHFEDQGKGVSWTSSECWVKNPEMFRLLTSPTAKTVSGYCKNGIIGATFKSSSSDNFLDCEGKALRAGPKVKGFEYNEKLRRCKLLFTKPTFVRAPTGEFDVWCYVRNVQKEKLLSVPEVTYPIHRLPNNRRAFCRAKFAERYLKPFTLSIKKQSTSHDIDEKELLDYFTDKSDGTLGSGLNFRPYETCYADLGPQAKCFHLDADVFRHECICDQDLPSKESLLTLPMDKRLRASFKPRAYRKCYSRVLRRAKRLVGVPKPAHSARTAKALLKFQPLLSRACTELQKEIFPGKRNVFSIEKCVVSSTYRIMIRELEWALSCMVASSLCPGEIKSDSFTCHGWSGSRNPWW